jgi:phosphoribosyl-ATP pyrophosphohydrolase
MTDIYAGSPGSNSFVQINIPSGGYVATEILRYDAFVALLFKADTPPMMKLHAALGVTGEAGELGDVIKKECVYNKLLDRTHLVEELGDLRFYIQAVMNLYGVSEQEVLQVNANKLSVRYAGLRYSDAAAQTRADKPEGE